MKARNKVQAIIVSGLVFTGCSIVCGAGNAKGILNKQRPAPAVIPTNTPELKQADERVRECKTRLETAHKQLNAAKMVLNAADADLKAAVAEQKALALKITAQELADQSGLKKAAIAPTANAPTPISAATGPSESTPLEINAEPIQQSNQQANMPLIRQ